MIDLEVALSLIDGVAVELETEVVDIDNLCGRFLVDDLVSDYDAPPFDKSAMDGIAIVSTDNFVGARLALLDVIAAGDDKVVKVGAGSCTAIMTGGRIPDGADFVVRREFLKYDGDFVEIIEKEKFHNIIFCGENIKKGEVLLRRGLISPAEVGIIASNGNDKATVYRQLKVGIINTGSEIVEPGQELLDGQIFNSTGSQLRAQIRKYWSIPIYYGIVRDTREALAEVVEQAYAECDIVILSGGVSLGDFDYVPEVLNEFGVNKIFHHVRIKPGKPTFFGKKEGVYFLGLPGNPVSSYMIFEIFALPIIFQSYSKGKFTPRSISLRLSSEIKRKNTQRTEFLPVKIENSEIIPIVYHGSSHLNALERFDGIVKLDAGVSMLEAGEVVNVRFI
ncbi:MAG: molybdopterin molybdotransferase MoeA [Spirochaetales bacterium]|nr:molybdopterin molybdotransferase MoeA [Spirochaetales bacterium]